MKHALLIVSVMLFLSMSAVAQTDSAAVPEKESVRIMEASLWGGLSYPYLPLDFRDNWKSGYNFGLSYGYSLEPGSIGYGTLFLSAEFARMKRDYEKYDNATGIAQSGNVSWGGAVRSISVLANFRGTFAKDTRSIGPYVQIGVGFANIVQEELFVSPDSARGASKDSKSAFSWSFGVGVDAPFGEHTVVFVQARSVLAVLDPTRQYFPINAGVRYRW